jgi:hypothetical protein
MRGGARVIPRKAGATAPLALQAVPDRRRRVSDGVLVEASILARVLGLRLLTLDVTLVLVPADVSAPSPVSARPVPGRGLADAVRSISEGAELLEEARRNGPARPARAQRIRVLQSGSDRRIRPRPLSGRSA